MTSTTTTTTTPIIITPTVSSTDGDTVMTVPRIKKTAAIKSGPIPGAIIPIGPKPIKIPAYIKEAELAWECPLCKYVYSFSMVEDHISTCPHRIINCDQCNESMMAKKLEDHKNFLCLSVLMKCKHCDKTIKMSEFHEHFKNCILTKPTLCIKCNDSFCLTDLPGHFQTCSYNTNMLKMRQEMMDDLTTRFKLQKDDISDLLKEEFTTKTKIVTDQSTRSTLETLVNESSNKIKEQNETKLRQDIKEDLKIILNEIKTMMQEVIKGTNQPMNELCSTNNKINKRKKKSGNNTFRYTLNDYLLKFPFTTRQLVDDFRTFIDANKEKILGTENLQWKCKPFICVYEYGKTIKDTILRKKVQDIAIDDIEDFIRPILKTTSFRIDRQKIAKQSRPSVIDFFKHIDEMNDNDVIEIEEDDEETDEEEESDKKQKLDVYDYKDDECNDHIVNNINRALDERNKSHNTQAFNTNNFIIKKTNPMVITEISNKKLISISTSFINEVRNWCIEKEKIYEEKNDQMSSWQLFMHNSIGFLSAYNEEKKNLFKLTGYSDKQGICDEFLKIVKDPNYYILFQKNRQTLKYFTID